MKRIHIYMCLACALTLASCDDFLDADNLVKKDSSSVPTSLTDCDQLVTGIYASMNNLMNDVDQSPFFIFEMAGDDRFGGGSTSNTAAQSADRLLMKSDSFYESLWKRRYEGIFRANFALGSIPGVEIKDEATKNRLLGEAHFLRALYYLDLAQVFGEVPLVLQTEAVNLPKASAEELYAQIAADLKEAIGLLPATKVADDGTCGSRATKWTAEAYMARVFLFYTGYYGKDALPGGIDKAQVIGWIDDCVNNSGHDLVPDARSIWPYSDALVSACYKYGADNQLTWAGDGCIETLFALKFSNTAKNSSSDPENGRTNRLCEFFNVRKPVAGALTDAAPFCTVGYSNGPVCSKLWDDWKADPDYTGDPRREGSICDLKTETTYQGAPNKEIEATFLLAKKYVSVQAKNDEGKWTPLSAIYGGQTEAQISNVNDLILMRFADVLLMQSELKGDAAGLNRVRARAGLGELPYSLDNIKRERRYELCFEAVRWNDLRRWHDVGVIVTNQAGCAIKNQKADDVYQWHTGDRDFLKRYEATGGFFMIPETQVTESNGVLEQNRGWGPDFVWKKHPYTSI